MFSNGTEAMIWIEQNCENCWKYDPEKEIGKSKCKTEEEISLGFVDTDLISERVKRIIDLKVCPYKQEKRPVYKKRDKEPLTLFKENIDDSQIPDREGLSYNDEILLWLKKEEK